MMRNTAHGVMITSFVSSRHRHKNPCNKIYEEVHLENVVGAEEEVEEEDEDEDEDEEEVNGDNEDKITIVLHRVDPSTIMLMPIDQDVAVTDHHGAVHRIAIQKCHIHKFHPKYCRVNHIALRWWACVNLCRPRHNLNVFISSRCFRDSIALKNYHDGDGTGAGAGNDGHGGMMVVYVCVCVIGARLNCVLVTITVLKFGKTPSFNANT